jgi:hypothetical protein
LHNYPLDSQNCTMEIESCKQIGYQFKFKYWLYRT